MVSETRSPNTLVIITLVGRSSVWRAGALAPQSVATMAWND